MFASNYLQCLALMCVVSGSCLAREWTHQGQPISGEFEQRHGEQVYLRQGSSRLVVTLSELSEKDQAFVESLTKEHTWTSQSGKQIIASFVRRDAEAVTILKDGKEFTIPIALLAQSDQWYLGKKHPWAGELPIAPATAVEDRAALPVESENAKASTGPLRSTETPKGDVRTWTRNNGTTVRGQFSRIDDETVWLVSDFGPIDISFKSLSSQDQDYLRRFQGVTLEISEPSDLKPASPTVEQVTRNDSVADSQDTELTVWRLATGETLHGRLITIEHDAAWFETESEVTSVMLSDLDREEMFRALHLHTAQVVQAAHSGRELPQMDRSALPVRPNEVAKPAQTAETRGPTCHSCGKAADIAPGERCPHCGAQKHWAHQLKIGAGPTHFPDVPGPNSRPSESLRIRGRGLAKLAIGIGLLLCSAIAGLFRFLFGTNSAEQQ